MVQHLFGIVAVAILSMLILIHHRPVQSNQGIVIQHVQADTNQQQFFANYHSAAAAEGNYLIGFEDSVENITTSTNDLQQLIPQLKIRHIFPCLKAISVSTLSTKHAHFIQSVSTVAYIEPDDTVEAMRVQKLQNVTTSWGIDRVDGKIDQRYHYAYTGRGVRVYIIDSGIQVSHNEFQTTVSQKNNNNVTTTTKQRARCGKNLRNDLGENCNDEWGHGTHVAAIIGGKTYGVAKNVNLVALKVFGADGTSRFSDIIAALEFVVQQKRNEPNVPMVINMSLGTKRKAILLNRAVDKATEAGIPVVVAAGNGGINACRYSPASASSAITVAASTAKEYVYDSCHDDAIYYYGGGNELTFTLSLSLFLSVNVYPIVIGGDVWIFTRREMPFGRHGVERAPPVRFKLVHHRRPRMSLVQWHSIWNKMPT